MSHTPNRKSKTRTFLKSCFFAVNAPAKIIGGSRKKRIANGSGTDISMVNKLLKQHKMMTNVMKKMSKGGRGALQGLDGIPPELLNNLK